MKLTKRVVATMTVSAKTGLCVRCLGKAMKNLKQHFYKLKQIKTPAVIHNNEHYEAMMGNVPVFPSLWLILIMD